MGGVRAGKKIRQHLPQWWPKFPGVGNHCISLDLRIYGFVGMYISKDKSQIFEDLSMDVWLQAILNFDFKMRRTWLDDPKLQGVDDVSPRHTQLSVSLWCALYQEMWTAGGSNKKKTAGQCWSCVGWAVWAAIRCKVLFGADFIWLVVWNIYIHLLFFHILGIIIPSN